jgi:hypothetical protein
MTPQTLKILVPVMAGLIVLLQAVLQYVTTGHFDVPQLLAAFTNLSAGFAAGGVIVKRPEDLSPKQQRQAEEDWRLDP